MIKIICLLLSTCILAAAAGDPAWQIEPDPPSPGFDYRAFVLTIIVGLGVIGIYGIFRNRKR